MRTIKDIVYKKRSEGIEVPLNVKAMNENTIELLKWILTGLLGTGWIGTFMFYRTRKKKANIEADKEELQLDIDQIEHLKKQNREAYETIEKLQSIINELRAKNIEDAKKINDLELKLIESNSKQKLAEYNACIIDNCCDRIPKREIDICLKRKEEKQ